MKQRFVNIKIILPKNSYTNQPLIMEESNNKLIIYYLNRYNNDKLKTKKFQPKKARFAKKIEITKDVVECIGLYQGDGQKSIKSKSYQSVRFSNSEPVLIQQFLEFLKQFYITQKDLKVYIRVRTKKNLDPKGIIDHWHNLTKIPKRNFYKPSFIPVKGDKYHRRGTATIIYQNSSFRVIFDALFRHIKKIALTDKQLAASFIRGLMAADGNVYCKKSAREVNIAAKYEEDRLFIRRLFSLLGIISNKDNLTIGKETVRVTGYPNFQIIKKHNLCNLHPNKRYKFLELINSYKSICYRKNTCIPLILDILKNKPQTVKNLSIKLNRKPNTIRRYLHKLESQNQITRSLNNREFPTGRIKEIWNIA